MWSSYYEGMTTAAQCAFVSVESFKMALCRGTSKLGKLQTFLVPLVKPKKMDFIRLCPVSTRLCQIASRSSIVLEEVNSNKNLSQQINFMYNLKESIAQKDLHWLL